MFKHISFRSQLDGEILQYLRDEGIECTRTTEAVSQAVISLANHREEGVSLFPKVFIMNNIDNCINVLTGREQIELGHGALHSDTIKDAIKRCSPLSRGGWSIYINRQSTNCTYGLFTASNSPLSISPTELLMQPPVAGTNFLPSILLLEQLAENLVELRSNTGN